MADITPICNKNEATNVVNYRPVSILSTVFKTHERLLYQQIAYYMEKYLSENGFLVMIHYPTLFITHVRNT